MPETDSSPSASVETVDRGKYLTTYGGGRFYPASPNAGEVGPKALAHALALTNRYGGHTDRPYSVAEHSVRCSWEAAARGLGPRMQLILLLHDAAEAYLGDIVSPVKQLLEPFYELEENCQAVIHESFGLPWPLSAEENAAVRSIDLAVGAAECLAFGMAITPGREQEAIELQKSDLCWDWNKAQCEWAKTLVHLMNKLELDEGMRFLIERTTSNQEQ